MWPFTPKKPDPKLEALRQEYDALVPRMIEDRIETVEGIQAFICVRPLLANARGRLALKVAHNSFGNWAVHEINKDGSFSQSGPYWIKSRQDTWRSNGQYAEVVLLLARDGTHFKIKHPYQDGGVHRIGFKVVDFNTPKLPIIEWSNYKWSRGA